MTRRTFNNVRFTFRHKTNISSSSIIFRRMSILTGIKPVIYDCCPNSCIAYTRKYIHHSSCPICNERRFQANGQPRSQFTYFPLIPRLQGFFQSNQTVARMSYCRDFRPHESKICDIFDSAHYQHLLRHRVVLDGEKLSHRYFSDPRDIALSLSTDSYLLNGQRRKGPCATPIVLQNYNLPPKCRTRLDNLLCVGIIPGPHQPKDVGSFLCPLDDELAELACGVPTFDAATKSVFDLHAYNLFKLGDIVAIEKFLKIKGHNGIHPCRSCKIKGVRGDGRTYYVPIHPPRDLANADEHIEWDPRNLPLRSHQDFIAITTQISEAPQKLRKSESQSRLASRAFLVLPGYCRLTTPVACHGSGSTCSWRTSSRISSTFGLASSRVWILETNRIIFNHISGKRLVAKQQQRSKTSPHHSCVSSATSLLTGHCLLRNHGVSGSSTSLPSSWKIAS